MDDPVADVVAQPTATTPITGVYLRDPDGNLVELSNYRDR